jgi:hypothetical protein
MAGEEGDPLGSLNFEVFDEGLGGGKPSNTKWREQHDPRGGFRFAETSKIVTGNVPHGAGGLRADDASHGERDEGGEKRLHGVGGWRIWARRKWGRARLGLREGGASAQASGRSRPEWR